MSTRNSEIYIEGNVGRSYEVSPNNPEVGSFTVAVSNGKDQEPDWYTVQVWNEFLRDVASKITKGNKVMVRGTPHIRKYTNKSGTPITLVLVNAISIGVIPKQTVSQQSVVSRKNTVGIPSTIKATPKKAPIIEVETGEEATEIDLSIYDDMPLIAD